MYAGADALLRVLASSSSLTDLRVESNDIKFDQHETMAQLLARHAAAYRSDAKRRHEEEITRSVLPRRVCVHAQEELIHA